MSANNQTVTRAEFDRAVAAAAESAAQTANARLAAIMALDGARELQELAKHLAFNTDMSIPEARAILTKTRQDLDTHRSQAGPVPAKVREEIWQAGAAKSYARFKHAEGALGGPAHSAPGSGFDAKAGWKRAVERANAQYGLT